MIRWPSGPIWVMLAPIMGKTYNWAILGCGKIARKFTADLSLLPNARLHAAASRSIERAKSFAAEFGFRKAYGSYEEMVDDPEVDVVYIASPHSHHHEHAVLCSSHRKAVLCEKAFAINSREVESMIESARANDTFLMEAFWTRFQPSFLKAMEIIHSGELGELKMVRSDFAFNAEYDADKRLYNVDLGGGSLLDIGIYPIFMSLMALGKPSEIRTMASFSPTGAEETIMMSFGYPGGRMASLVSSFASHSPTQAEFWLENGYVRMNRQFNAPTSVTVFKKGGGERTITFPEGIGSGYELEAAHVMECLDSGKRESDLMPLSLSTDLMEILDRVRREAGIVFPRHDGVIPARG
ncbi:MAG: Gfo/Idh/MocA family oxidoreductase [Spirochaetales bacterium]|nr:MAG: Gfo/Idh/MocA family oxidoreductase [Spirochaetales bacterium]